MHQIRFRLGLRPRPRWESSQRSPRSLSCVSEVLLLRKKGEEKKTGKKEKQQQKEKKRREREGQKRRGFQYTFLATSLRKKGKGNEKGENGKDKKN